MGSKRVALTSADGFRLDADWHEGGDRVVVMAHGLTVDSTENGLFEPLADALLASGLSVLRFSFRGHGRSGGGPRDVTVAGARLDLRAAVDWVGRPVALLGSSFGGAIVSLSLAALTGTVRAVVLWQPVLDTRRTFLEPELAAGRELYGGRGNGPVNVDGRFRLEAGLFDELATVDPRAAFQASTEPALVVHGDADSLVSHDIARDTALRRPGTEWHSVPGGEHGFLAAAAATEVVDVTARWLSANG